MRGEKLVSVMFYNTTVMKPKEVLKVDRLFTLTLLPTGDMSGKGNRETFQVESVCDFKHLNFQSIFYQRISKDFTSIYTPKKL